MPSGFNAYGLRLAVLALSLACTQAAAQEADALPAEQQAAYHDAVTHAVAEFEAQHFAEARALFLRAHELWPSARTLRTLGMTSFELRTYPRALEELQQALADTRRPLNDQQRRELETLLARTRSFIGRYRLQLSPANAELLVDGAPHAAAGELVLPVGEHVLIARAPEYSELRRTISVQGREDEALSLRLERIPIQLPAQPMAAAAPADSGRLKRVTSVIAFSTGAAGLIASAVFAGLSLSDKHAIEPHCPERMCPPPFQSKEAEMKRFANFASVGLIVGIVGAAAGSYLWLTADSSPAAPELALAVTPGIRIDANGVSGAF